MSPPLKWRRFKPLTFGDLCIGASKQFLVAERAVLTAPGNISQTLFMNSDHNVCVSVCVHVCLCVCRRDSATGHSRPKRPLKTRPQLPALWGDSSHHLRQKGGKPQPDWEDRNGRVLMLISGERRKIPGRSEQFSVWSDIYQHAPALAAQKADFGGTCLADTCGRRTDGRKRGPRRGGSGTGLKEAALQSARAPGAGKTGGLPHASPCLSAPAGHRLGTPYKDCCFNAFFFFLNSTYFKKQLIKK